VGLLTSNRVIKGRTLEFELRKPFDALVSAANRENGWGERIRTFDYLIQSQAPYQLGHAPAGRVRPPQSIKRFPEISLL
jgi:hypothetical protein